MADPNGTSEVDPILVSCARFGVEVEPDFALPAQLMQYAPTLDPGVRRLMLAIFEDAIRVLRRGPRGRKPTDYDNAILWVASDERWVFSFVDLCETLGFDPTRMRARVQAIQVRQSAPTIRRTTLEVVYCAVPVSNGNGHRLNGLRRA